MSKAYGSIPVVIEGGDGQEIISTATIVTAGISSSSTSTGMKQGHSCCGGCCDMRRAVITVNFVMIGLLLLDIIGYNFLSELIFDDDEINTAISSMQFYLFINILCYGIGIWGAYTFNARKVFFTLVIYSITILMDIISFNVGGIILHGCFVYPHIFLYKEIKSGIMTEDNYHNNEKQSCCCV